MTIVEYKPCHKEAVRALNEAWIKEYFELEPRDLTELADPAASILAKGGQIFMAVEQGLAVGTVALKPLKDGTLELCKMAVTPSSQGRGIGRLLLYHALMAAKEMAPEKRLVLYSNTCLEAAIHLYRQLGFEEIPLEEGRYTRSNIKMAMAVNRIPDLFSHSE